MREVIYMAGDIFTEGGRDFLFKCEQEMSKGLQMRGLENMYKIYNPANNLNINNKEVFTSNENILLADQAQLDKAVAVFACMDTIDTGVAFEIGYAWAESKAIYQLYTDTRLLGNTSIAKLNAIAADVHQNNFLYMNQMVTGSSYIVRTGEQLSQKRVFTSIADIVNTIGADLARGVI